MNSKTTGIMEKAMHVGRIVGGALALALTLWTPCAAVAGEELVMRIPKMSQPPKIDGTIEAVEWAGAFATTGFRGAIYATAYPESLGTLWYVGYDDKNLYMAMRTVFPESISLKSDMAKTAKDGKVETLIFDDHLEITATPHGRDCALRAGFGNYKICANPRGVISDDWYYNGSPGSETVWSFGGELKCETTKTSWTMEMSWPLSSMKIKKADNAELIMHCSRAGSCSGWYFASWGPGQYMSWNEFYRVILDPGAPALQFLRHGPLVDGKLDTLVRVGGKNADKVEVALEMENAEKQVVFQETKRLDVPAGGQAEAVFKADKLPLSPPAKGAANQYSLRVSDAKGLLYNCAMPVILHTPEYVAKYLEPYLNSRPKEGDYKIQLAYLPGSNMARVTLDLDVFGGVPAKLAGAKRFSVEVAPKTGGKTAAKQDYPIENLGGVGRLEVGKLPEGDYACVVRLLDGAGGELDARTVAFKCEHYPWEGNHLGEDPVVIPPFTPLQVSERTVKSCRGAFAVGERGLLDSVKVDGAELLGGPMRVEASAGGKTATWTGDAATLEKVSGRSFPPAYANYVWDKKCPKLKFEDLPPTDGYAVRVSGQAEAEGLALAVKGTMDYDGWYDVALTYGPKAGQTEVGSLEVVIPLGRFADVMFSRPGLWLAGLRRPYPGGGGRGVGQRFDRLQAILVPRDLGALCLPW